MQVPKRQSCLARSFKAQAAKIHIHLQLRYIPFSGNPILNPVLRNLGFTKYKEIPWRDFRGIFSSDFPFKGIPLAFVLRITAEAGDHLEYYFNNAGEMFWWLNHCYNRGPENWLNTGYILKIGLTGFARHLFTCSLKGDDSYQG